MEIKIVLIVNSLQHVARIKNTFIEILPYPVWQTLAKTGPLVQALESSFLRSGSLLLYRTS